jgi:2-polyprenyl-6-methoxyphenol hydroxylase-like FAD-dependent oxidoreductase
VRFGVAVVILDDRPDKTSTGKADGMQPKTIETFRQLRLADPLLKNGARVFDISFWVSFLLCVNLTLLTQSQESTAHQPLRRTGRKAHYPEHLVGASDPYILLAHQGMVEEVMIDDMESRGVFVTRNSHFASCTTVKGTNQLDIVYDDILTNKSHTIRANYLVGCDGARSKVRAYIPDADLEGEITNAAWGVLDGRSIQSLWGMH